MVKKWESNKSSKSNDDTSFQHAVTGALNHQNIEKDPQNISKCKSFIDQYNWK